MDELEPDFYTVAWIAPLEIEAQAALHMLENHHQGRFSLDRGDDYVFRAGDIGGHNIIIATLPAGQEYGTGSAAALASQVKKFFPNLWFGLLVGVAAGLPNLSQCPPRDIRLGDVLVGLPVGDSAGLIAYDLGKETGHDGFQLLHYGHVLANTETVVRSAIQNIKLTAPHDLDTFLSYYEDIRHKRHANGVFDDPGQDHDHLYQIDDSGNEYLVQREQRPDSERTRVWYGPIGSGEKLIKNAQKRNELRDKYGIIGLEMEAAGTMNRIPVGVIRGVCDYGDEHKNKEWQPYAAAMAAAYAKAVLYEIRPKISTSLASAKHDNGQKLTLPTYINKTYSTDINDLCIRALRGPDTWAVKNRLKENKDKLLYESIEWLFQASKYVQWQDRDKISLLWIKGGAGKGKTMMSIGLIERLSTLQDYSTVVTYFFCQNADHELNTLEAILKGLILRLVNEREELKQSLRNRWDPVHNRFEEDITSWRTLWNIFLEMLDRCRCQRVFVVVDALDECQDEGMADFLKLLVRTGLDQPGKVKWLLTSRPLESAESELLGGHEQEKVSLELNLEHISKAVKIYIAFKVSELHRRHSYGEILRQKIEAELTAKAEDTYLWVSLVCKQLESVQQSEVLNIVQNMPTGLPELYHRIFRQLREGESVKVKRRMRLLKVMMLAYRPLDLAEVGSVMGVTDQEVTIRAVVDQCASFIRMRGTDIEFVHQSARDYLAGTGGQSTLALYEPYGHGEIALSCLVFLSERLKVNLINLPRPDSNRELIREMKDDSSHLLMASVDYAASFWVRHLKNAKEATLVQNALAEEGAVSIFLYTRLLEWLECLSLLDQLPRAIEALKIITDETSKRYSLYIFAQDATRFLLRHYQTITNWPLQTYSSAIIFSPETSDVRRRNINRLPAWLEKVPRVEAAWTSLIQTLAGHSGSVSSVAFSPDGRHIASGSYDRTIKLWDITTGDLQKTLAGHSGSVSSVAFSPDGRHIASGSYDRTIKLRDIATGELQKTLAGHSSPVSSVAFSLDGRHIASGSWDKTVKLWDVAKYLKPTRLFGSKLNRVRNLRSVWETQSPGPVGTLKFSADGKYLATDTGPIRLEGFLGARENSEVKSLANIWVGHQWICYETSAILRLPADFQSTCYDVQGNMLAIGFQNGRVLVFGIDRDDLDLRLG